MSCHGSSSVSTAAAFIDLATFAEGDSFGYGGPHAISWFVAGVQKANWFSIVPIQLRNNGTFDFGQESVSSTLNRSGDYVLNCWFRCQIPSIGYTTPGAIPTGNSVRWTRNLMHNLIKRVSITFNELTVEEFDNYWLDFNYMYRIPSNKIAGYRAMIGDIPSLTTPLDSSIPHNNVGGVLLGGFFTVVLPFYFGEDSGIALPVGALPFNDTKINYEFRNIDDLLVFNGDDAANNISALTAYTVEYTAQNSNPAAVTYAPRSTMAFTHGYTYAHYAVIHNDERVKMGDAPRDILMRQVQTVCGHDLVSGATEYYQDLRLSHGIIQYYFALRNKSVKGEWSNYTTNINYGVVPNAAPNWVPLNQGYSKYWDPIASSALVYENTTRLDFGADFYNLIHPYLVNDALPTANGDLPGLGTHTWSYALKPWDPLSPSGSTNYSKLANVQIRHRLSDQAKINLGQNLLTGGTQGAVAVPLKLHGVFTAQNWNIVRVANGSIGHPTL